jgi:outer membrane protein
MFGGMRIFRKTRVPAAAFALLASLMAIAPAQAADITVVAREIPADAEVVVQVYDSANSFGDFRNPLREVRGARSADDRYRLADIPAGEVAILVYVDSNKNGIIDKNFIGIPKEPLGISNNYRPKGPPVFDSAKVTVTEGVDNLVDVEIYKVLGERGRLGVGAGVIGRSSPYVGSDTTVLQAIPAITYNGERLQWLGPNIQYGLLGSGKWRMAASASYRIGAYEEDDSPALAGMADRDSTLMAGLGVRYESDRGINMVLRYEHDVLDNIGGGSATARASKSFQFGWLRISPQLQLNWLSADLANHDFGVAASEATLARPAYDVGSFLSYELGMSSFIELTEEWRIVLNISAEKLPGEVADSPIVADDLLWKGFAAITYIF